MSLSMISLTQNTRQFIRRVAPCSFKAARNPGILSNFSISGFTTSIWKYKDFDDARILKLNELKNIPGSKKLRRRWGRGTGSGRGKLCGWGHQKSRSTPRGFEGGQTPLYKRLPKIGFHNFTERDLEILNLGKLQQFIDMGKFPVKSDSLTTMRDFIEYGLLTTTRDGVKLLAKGKETFTAPIHLEVSFASKEAIEAVTKAGGTVTCAYFNKLAMRALIKPFKFGLLPRRARPSPKIVEYYLDASKAGYLSPEIQQRNLSLFGYVTSEEIMREEHENFLNYQRMRLRKKRENEIIGMNNSKELKENRKIVQN